MSQGYVLWTEYRERSTWAAKKATKKKKKSKESGTREQVKRNDNEEIIFITLTIYYICSQSETTQVLAPCAFRASVLTFIAHFLNLQVGREIVLTFYGLDCD